MLTRILIIKYLKEKIGVRSIPICNKNTYKSTHKQKKKYFLDQSVYYTYIWLYSMRKDKQENIIKCINICIYRYYLWKVMY